MESKRGYTYIDIFAESSNSTKFYKTDSKKGYHSIKN